jgi:hypothetical protein
MLNLLVLITLPLLPFVSPIPSNSSPFHEVIPTPNKVTIRNSCDYPVYITPVYGGPYGSVSPSRKIILAGGYSWVSDFIYLPFGVSHSKYRKCKTSQLLCNLSTHLKPLTKCGTTLAFSTVLRVQRGRIRVHVLDGSAACKLCVVPGICSSVRRMNTVTRVDTSFLKMAINLGHQ